MSRYGWTFGSLGIYRGAPSEVGFAINAERGIRTRLWGISLGRFGLLWIVRANPPKGNK